MSTVTDKEIVFVDEPIRGNARLTVQHEVDRLMLVQHIPAEEYQAEAAGGVCLCGQGQAGGQQMTLKELSQLYYLNREIEMDKKRLQELEIMAVSISPNLSGMPRSPGVSDKVGRYAAEIADLKGIIEAKHQQCLYERSRLERYIAGIDDSFLRQVMTYRFINGLPWRRVAACIGGGNTEDGCRKAVKRYLKRN